MLLQETPAVFSEDKLYDEHGYTYHWKSGQNPHLIKNGMRIGCKKSNYVPFVVPGISASSSSTTLSPASSPSSSQESTPENRDSVSENRDVEAPVSDRSGGTNEELRGDPLQNYVVGQQRQHISELLFEKISHVMDQRSGDG